MEETGPRQGDFQVLLVSTLSEVSSYGLRCLASLLNGRGISTDLLFAVAVSRFDNAVRKKSHGVFDERFVSNFIEFVRPYSLVGFTVFTDNLPECIQLSEAIRRRYPGKKIIFGGIHATVAPRECLGYADYVCVGDGFISFPELVMSLAGARKGAAQDGGGAHGGLPAGIWGNASGAVSENGVGRTLMELDELPYPTYDARRTFIRTPGNGIVNVGKKELDRHLGLSYYTMMSIGCPYSCTYCCNTVLKRLTPEGKIVRWHSPEYIVGEIAAAREAYGFQSVWFMDDAFIAMGDDMFERFIRLYTEKVGLPFVIGGIIPTIALRHRGRVERLIDAGMVRGRIGVQSGSERMLRSYRRVQSNDEVVAVSRIFSAASGRGVRASYDIILDGFSEEPRDVLDTLKLVNLLSRPIMLNLFSLRVYPGTELHEITGMPYDRDNGYLACQPTLGNMLINTVNFIRTPRFVMRRIESDPSVLNRRVPRLLARTLDWMAISQRIWSQVVTGANGRIPLVFVYLIKLKGRLSRPAAN